MDRILIAKILGKNNALILEDQIFCLREILELLRSSFIEERILSARDIDSTYKRFLEIKEIINKLKIYLDYDNVIGYTNSKVYLKKYISDIILNIEKVLDKMKNQSLRDYITDVNILIDLVLIY